jgi:hypothetical protein
LLTYFSICAGIAYIIYKEQKKYYEPMYIMKKTGEGKDDEKVLIFMMNLMNLQEGILLLVS